MSENKGKKLRSLLNIWALSYLKKYWSGKVSETLGRWGRHGYTLFVYFRLSGQYRKIGYRKRTPENLDNVWVP